MYREVALHLQDQEYHQFLLRDSDGKIKDCRMLRVTFGVSASPCKSGSTTTLRR